MRDEPPDNNLLIKKENQIGFYEHEEIESRITSTIDLCQFPEIRNRNDVGTTGNN